jgi:hypothetical protein
MKGPVPLLLASLLALGGCSSTRELSSEQRNASDAITRAEKAGAKRYSSAELESAKDDLERARLAEDAATRDRKVAREQLASAQRRNERARRRLQMRRALLESDEEERRNQIAALEANEAHAEELRAKGVPPDEVARLSDGEASMIKIRIRNLESEIESIKREIAAMESVQKDSNLEIEMAQARLKSAEDRLEASRAIYAHVEQRANLARAEALDARRTELSEKIEKLSP